MKEFKDLFGSFYRTTTHRCYIIHNITLQEQSEQRLIHFGNVATAKAAWNCKLNEIENAREIERDTVQQTGRTHSDRAKEIEKKRTQDIVESTGTGKQELCDRERKSKNKETKAHLR